MHFRQWKRRDFITLLGGAAAAWPLAAGAQQQGKPPTIGFLGSSTPLAMSQSVTAFVQRLRQLGWIEGHNLAIEYRWAEGRNERFAEIAPEFVRLKVDLIVASTTPAVIATKQATSVIPIVFAATNDLVGTGLVRSLAQPGGNVTGLSGQIADTASKRLELLSEVVPSLRRLAILANVGNPGTVLDMREVQATARMVGLEATTFEIRHAEDIAAIVMPRVPARRASRKSPWRCSAAKALALRCAAAPANLVLSCALLRSARSCGWTIPINRLFAPRQARRFLFANG